MVFLWFVHGIFKVFVEWDHSDGRMGDSLWTVLIVLFSRGRPLSWVVVLSMHLCIMPNAYIYTNTLWWPLYNKLYVKQQSDMVNSIQLKQECAHLYELYETKFKSAIYTLHKQYPSNFKQGCAHLDVCMYTPGMNYINLWTLQRAYRNISHLRKGDLWRSF